MRRTRFCADNVLSAMLIPLNLQSLQGRAAFRKRAATLFLISLSMTNAIDLVVALNPDHSAFSALLQQLKATAAVHHIYIATPDADAAAPYTDEH